MKQGLAIGNNPDSYLANVYLMNIDSQMELEGVEYGRYTDDIRIFTNDIGIMRHAIIVLQEALLNLGLNLNSAKTKLASSGVEIEKHRSKYIDMYDYAEPDEEIVPESKLLEEIDRDFKNPAKEFNKEDVIANDGDAKDFCKFLSANQKIKKALDNMKFMKVWHIENLGKIVRDFSGAGKHAAWLLVQAAFYESVHPKVSEKALQTIGQIFEDETVNSYIKYRVTHFLAKRHRKNGKFRVNMFDDSTRHWFIDRFTEFLAQPAIELNLVAIRALNVMGLSEGEILKLAGTYVKKPVPLPVNTALRALSLPPESYGTGRIQAEAEEENEFIDYI